jgi:predicted DNA-binding WGR domain protein
MNNTTRHFEFKDDKSAKFWEIIQAGETIMVRYGKTGTNGQSQEKAFADAAAAGKHAEKLIAEKLGKGYVEQGSAPATGAEAPAAPKVPVEKALKPGAESAAKKVSVKAAKAQPVKPAKPKNPAQDPEAAPECLMALLDKDDATNRLLAKHPRASAELLEKLSHSSDKATRKNVLLNPDTPRSVLLKLAPQFPRYFIRNPAFDWLLLEEPDLLTNLGQGVLKNVLKTPECPESFMRWAVGFGSDDEKLAVAMNRNAPTECLQELAKCHSSVSSAALGHVKLNCLPISPNLEEAFLTEVKANLHNMSCLDAEYLFKKNLIDLPHLSFLNSAVRLFLAKLQISVECYLKEVSSPDPSELMNFFWRCYFNYEFEDVQPKLWDIDAVRPNLFHENHVNLLIENVERRLESFLKLSDEAFVWQETGSLIFLISCMPPDAVFPDRIYQLLDRCNLKREATGSDLLEVCRNAAEHQHCPTWFKEKYADSQITGTVPSRVYPGFDIHLLMSCLQSIKENWLTNNKEDFKFNREYLEKSIGDGIFWRYAEFNTEDLDRIFMGIFDLYALLDRQTIGWAEQDTREFSHLIITVIRHIFQSGSCPRDLLIDVTQQKDRRFAKLIELAKAALDLHLVIHQPKNSHWFLSRQRRTRDVAVASSVLADNVLFIRDTKAQTACNSKDLIARVFGLSHRFAQPKVLAKRCNSLYWIERMAIARNPNTPLNILEVLKSDAHVLVSHQADISAKRLRDVRLCTDTSSFPGKDSILSSPCPNCGGQIVNDESYDNGKGGFKCKGNTLSGKGCGFKVQKIIANRTLSFDEVELLLRDKRLGPIDGFRSKAGWPFTAVLALKFDAEANNYKLEFDFDDDKPSEESAEPIDFSVQTSLGVCPKCGEGVYEHGSNYVCEKSVPTLAQPTPVCDFKCGRLILQQPIADDQMRKLLETGKTDIFDKFVSMRSRQAFRARLVWDAAAGKVNFEFLPQSFKAAPTVPRKRKLRPPMQFLRKTPMA